MRAIATFLLVVLTAACWRSADLPEGAAAIQVHAAFVELPAEGSDTALAGMRISLIGAPRTLIGASSPAARRIELHTTSSADGMSRMRRVDRLEVDQKTPLILGHGGNHLMLLGIRGPLQAGDMVNLVLTFEDPGGNQQDVLASAEIVPAGG